MNIHGLKTIVLLFLLSSLLLLSACAGPAGNPEAETTVAAETEAPSVTAAADPPAGSSAAEADGAASETASEAVSPSAEIKAAEGYVLSADVTDLVDILMDSGQHMVLRLRPDAAPKSVENFRKLVAQGFYDGLTFHRIIPGFMIQGGDPDGTGMGGSAETIPGEFSANGVDNPLSHQRGTLSMARSNDPNSASSQFFICHAAAPHLDGQYAAFGELVFGEAELDRIAALKTGENDRPENLPVMVKVFFVTEAK